MQITVQDIIALPPLTSLQYVKLMMLTSLILIFNITIQKL